MKKARILFSALSIIFVIGAVPMAFSEEAEDFPKMKLFFGHQSVGYNIIDGITDLDPESQQLIIRTSEAPNSEAFLAHQEVGVNNEPETKLRDFAEILNNGMGASVDAAFLKFCYVDIRRETDVEALFAAYKTAAADLKKRFPELVLIHFTAPLTTMETGPKAFVKKLLGRKLYGTDHNLKRHEYNELLRNEYAGKEPIFDLALIESTYENGKRNMWNYEGQEFYSLIPEYTDDGGHLNEKGRRIVAAELLRTLSEISAGAEK